MLGERVVDLTSQMSPKPRQATEQAHGRYIEVGPLSAPLRQDFLDVIHIRVHRR